MYRRSVHLGFLIVAFLSTMVQFFILSFNDMKSHKEISEDQVIRIEG